MKPRIAGLLLAGVIAAQGQSVRIRLAPKLYLPVLPDGNSPAFWTEEGLNVFTSPGDPLMINTAPSQIGPWESQPVDVTDFHHLPAWVEAVFRDADGTLFGWYHHEPEGVCGSNSLSAPKIGAVISYDNGKTVKDLGIILESGEAPDCNAGNGFFAGGHGDFSVVPAADGFFYFFYTNYSGPVERQGIAVARLAYEDRYYPAGAVWKYSEAGWVEPGIGGAVTPLFPARQGWERDDADSFWGPSVHWNHHLRRFVMLLNRACCGPNWPQEGIYISYGTNPADPASWTEPQRIMTPQDIGYRPGYYPQVLGLNDGETDSYAGEFARLYIHGASTWEIQFVRPPEGSQVESEGRR